MILWVGDDNLIQFVNGTEYRGLENVISISMHVLVETCILCCMKYKLQ